jgi:enoyl-CoA hydratase
MSEILFEKMPGQVGALGLITLNRPQALNALSHEMIIKMYQQLIHWKEDAEVKAIVIQGAGEKAFCAGGDIRKVYDAKNDEALTMKQFFWDEYRLNSLIHHYSKPYIALLNGITMGGGVGVSLHGSHRVATEKFLFAMPETGIGFFPDIGGSYFLSRCKGRMGIYLGLTGARIKAADALYLNIANHFVGAEKLAELISVLAASDLGGNAYQKLIFTSIKKA